VGRSTQTLIILLVAFTVLIAVETMAGPGGVPASGSAAFPIVTAPPPSLSGAAPTGTASPPHATAVQVAPATAPAIAGVTHAPTPPTSPATATTTAATVTSGPSGTTTAGPATTTSRPTAVATVMTTRSATTRVATVTATTTITTGLTPASATVTATLPSSGLAVATAPSGVLGVNSPPHYGLYYNYIDNTPYLATYVATLDRHLIALTNAQRVAQGLAPLVESDNLDIIAAARAQDMIVRGYFSHYDPTGPVDASGRHAAAVQELLARNSVPYAEVGENLVDQSGGYAFNDNTPTDVVTAFMHHPEHRANILYPAYGAIGVGMALRQEADGLRVVIAQVFVR